MGLSVGELTGSAHDALRDQDAELAFLRERQFLQVVRKTANGSGDVNHTFALDRKYRLLFVRGHFAGGSGFAPIVLWLDSGAGPAFDAKLFTVIQAGTGRDVHLRIGGGDTAEPSAWTFRPDDALRLQWTNPDPGNMSWGMEVGMAMVS